MEKTKMAVWALVSEFIELLPEDTAFNLQEAGLINSLAMLNIMSALEDELDIEFDAADLTKDNFRSVDSVWEMVCKYL